MDEGADDRLHDLRISEERHRLLAEHANDVVWTMSVDGRITYVSPAVTAVRGISPEVAMTQTLDQIHPPASAAISLGYFRDLHARLAEGLPPQEFRGELEYYRLDGSTVWTEVQVIPHVDDDGSLLEILGVTRDISERKRYEQELKAAHDALAEANARLRVLAITDDLTGLWNRRHLFDRAEQIFRQAVESGEDVAALLLDFDHFKAVNDQLGHAVGDEALASAAAVLRQEVRASDVVGRWGGEEFVVVAPQSPPTSTHRLAERLRQSFEERFRAWRPPLTTSIGLAQWRPGEDLSALLRRADDALYDAKAAGRNTIRAR